MKSLQTITTYTYKVSAVIQLTRAFVYESIVKVRQAITITLKSAKEAMSMSKSMVETST